MIKNLGKWSETKSISPGTFQVFPGSTDMIDPDLVAEDMVRMKVGEEEEMHISRNKELGEISKCSGCFLSPQLQL